MELKYTKLSRRLSMQDEAEQKEEVKKATILTYFYPEVTVERMSLIERSSKLSHRHRNCGILCLCEIIKVARLRM